MFIGSHGAAIAGSTEWHGVELPDALQDEEGRAVHVGVGHLVRSPGAYRPPTLTNFQLDFVVGVSQRDRRRNENLKSEPGHDATGAEAAATRSIAPL